MANDVFKEELYTNPIANNTTVGTQKILNMLFIVDTSGSMRYDGRIEAVNEAFAAMIPALRQVQMDARSEFELRIAIMSFNETASWIVEPTPILEYDHEPIVCSQWVTYYSRAFSALQDKLSKSEYMAHTGKIAAPYIMFMTDGEPTKDDEYNDELDILYENGWFTNAQRFAVLIGQDTIDSPAAREAVGRFVKDPIEGIVNAADATSIAGAVQAKTLHTVIGMTKHQVNNNTPSGDSGSDSGLGGTSGDPGDTAGTDPWNNGGNDNTDPWGDAMNPDDIFPGLSGNFV